MSQTCVGCGILLQSQNALEVGFVREDKRSGDVYCERCFELTHYNRVQNHPIASLDIPSLHIGLYDLVVYVIDATDIAWSLPRTNFSAIQKIPCIIVINKIDLLSNRTHSEKIRQFVLDAMHHYQSIIDCLSVSATFGFGCERLLQTINKQKAKSVYFLGETNVGKSSLMNALMVLSDVKRAPLSVSFHPYTTQFPIAIDIHKNKTWIDTQALTKTNHLFSFIEANSRKHIWRKLKMRPKTFQLYSDQTLFIQGFVRIDFTEGNLMSATTYFNNTLVIHRCKQANADGFFLAHMDDILQIPNPKERLVLGTWQKRLTHPISEKAEIDIQGLGLIQVIGDGQITIYTYSNCLISIRKAII